MLKGALPRRRDRVAQAKGEREEEPQDKAHCEPLALPPRKNLTPAFAGVRCVGSLLLIS